MLDQFIQFQIQNTQTIYGGDRHVGRDHGDEDGVPPDGQLG